VISWFFKFSFSLQLVPLYDQVWLGGTSNLLTLAEPYADRVKETDMEHFFEPIFFAFKVGGLDSC
jgi:hypothetical protein